jgi:hypothetical protein
MSRRFLLTYLFANALEGMACHIVAPERCECAFTYHLRRLVSELAWLFLR